MNAKLRSLAAKVLGLDESAIHPELGPDSVADWDSTKHMLLLMSVEEEFGLTLSDEDMISVGSIGDLARLVDRA